MIRSILVDDELHCLNTLRMLLEEHCPDVQILNQCSSAEEALKAIPQLRPDLVFLDIEMPFMNGFELLDSRMPWRA
jgi:two-component system LytT family response regulator